MKKLSIAVVLAGMMSLFAVGCSNYNEPNNFDNGSIGVGNLTGSVSQNNLRFMVGLREESELLYVESGQLQKKDGRWIISVKWLPKYQRKVENIIINPVGTFLPDEMKRMVPTNVTLLVQGENIYEETKENTAIFDPILGGWVQEETKFALINLTDRNNLVFLFSSALNAFARNNGAILLEPINLTAEYQEVVFGEYRESGHSLIGTWHMTIHGIDVDEMVAFYSDGTAIISSSNVMVLTYTIDNDGKVGLFFLNGNPLPHGFWEFTYNKSTDKVEDRSHGFPLQFDRVKEDGVAGIWYSDDYGYYYAFYPAGRGLFQTSVAFGDQTKITYTINGNIVEISSNGGISTDRFTYNGGDTFTNQDGIIFERLGAGK